MPIEFRPPTFPTELPSASTPSAARAYKEFMKLPEAERRNLVKDFNPEFYLDEHPEFDSAIEAAKRDTAARPAGVSASDINRMALNQFLNAGLKVNGDFRISPHFDENYYLSANPDVAKAVQSGKFKSGLDHYLQIGQDEGRSANKTGTSILNDLPKGKSISDYHRGQRINMLENKDAIEYDRKATKNTPS